VPHVFVSAFLHAAQAAWLLKSKSCRQIPDNLLILASGSALNFRLTVPATDTTFVPVTMDNLSLISNLTAFFYPRNSGAVFNQLVSPELPEARSH